MSPLRAVRPLKRVSPLERLWRRRATRTDPPTYPLALAITALAVVVDIR